MEAQWRPVAALRGRIVARGFVTYAGFRWLLRILLANAAVQVVALWLIGPITLATTPIALFDFTYYYVAALTLRLNPHANIYDPRVMPAVASAHHIVMSSAPGPFGYPLLLPIALIPLSYLSFQAAAVVWYLFNLLLWTLNIALLADWMRHGLFGASGCASGRREAGRAALVLCVFIGLSYGPLIDAQILGQASMLMLTCFLLAQWFERRGRPEIAGALLIIPTLIKLFPAFLIVYYVCRGRWRVALGAVVGLCVALAGMALVVGVGGVLSMRGVLQATSVGVLQTFHNQALARAPLWIAVEFGGAPSATTALLGDALIALVALAIAALLYVTRRYVTRRYVTRCGAASDQSGLSDAAFLDYAWALSGMLLVTPVTWNHYDIWLLPGILFGLGYSVRQLRWSAGRTWPWVLAIVGLLAALLLTGSDLPLGYDGNPTLSPGPFLLGHPLRPFFMLLRPLGALLVWLITGAMLLRLPSARLATSAPLAASAPPGQDAPSSAVTVPERVWWRPLYPVALIALVGPMVIRISFALIAGAALATLR